MANWTATTARGTTWRYAEGILRVERRGDPWPEVFKPWRMAVLPDDGKHISEGDGLRVDWEYVRQAWEDQARERAGADFVPVVGSLIYAGGREQWRISTPVVSVEVI